MRTFLTPILFAYRDTRKEQFPRISLAVTSTVRLLPSEPWSSTTVYSGPKSRLLFRDNTYFLISPAPLAVWHRSRKFSVKLREFYKFINSICPILNRHR